MFEHGLETTPRNSKSIKITVKQEPKKKVELIRKKVNKRLNYLHIIYRILFERIHQANRIQTGIGSIYKQTYDLRNLNLLRHFYKPRLVFYLEVKTLQ